MVKTVRQCIQDQGGINKLPFPDFAEQVRTKLPKDTSNAKSFMRAARRAISGGRFGYRRKGTLQAVRSRIGKLLKGFRRGLRESNQNARWQQMYKQLVKYKSDHGHCNVPKRDGGLGRWVNSQRHAFKKVSTLAPKFVTQHEKLTTRLCLPQGKLSKERQKHLNEVDFDYGMTLDERWEYMFEQFKENPNVSTGDGGLGRWVSEQRTTYKGVSSGVSDLKFVTQHEKLTTRLFLPQGKLSNERQKRLDEVDFDYGMTFDERWQQMYNQLVKYKSDHGHCNVSTGDGRLGSWVSEQRTTYKGVSSGVSDLKFVVEHEKLTIRLFLPQGKLSKERQKHLEEIGFDYGMPSDERWQQMYNQLVKYKSDHGHCNVSTGDGSLGHWVNKQRQAYKGVSSGVSDLKFVVEHEKLTIRLFLPQGKLSKERQKRLEEIGFQWKVGSGGKRKGAGRKKCA